MKSHAVHFPAGSLNPVLNALCYIHFSQCVSEAELTNARNPEHWDKKIKNKIKKNEKKKKKK